MFRGHIFPRLALDNHRAVRELAVTLLLSLVRKSKKLFASQLDHIIPPWWLVCHDPVQSIASTALEAFNAAFVAKKQPDVSTRASAHPFMQVTHTLSLLT